MDCRTLKYYFVSILLITVETNEEPACGSACAPRFEHDYKVLQKLANLETKQRSLEETINSQHNQIISQQNVIETLRQTLADQRKSSRPHEPNVTSYDVDGNGVSFMN